MDLSMNFLTNWDENGCELKEQTKLKNEQRNKESNDIFR